MSCSEIGDLIHGYIDGELDLGRSLEIERHMHHCPDCRRTCEEQQSLRSAIRGGHCYYEAPASLRMNIRSAIRRAGRSQEQASPIRWRWSFLWVPLAAAVIVLLLVTPFILRPRTEDIVTQEIADAHVRSLIAGHLTDVLSSDRHTVKPWFNGRVDFSPSVTDLAAQGFPLLGGRVDYVDNRPVAVLVYQRRQHVINLFIWPSADAGSGTEKRLAQHGYHMIRWAQSGMTFWVVSDVGAADLDEFVRLFKHS